MEKLKPKSDFMKIIMERGFYHQCSDFEQLDDIALNNKHIGYIGFDCTASSFHVGNLVQIMLLHWLQHTGGKPIVLIGGGTTYIGDPSGKDVSRKILNIEEIENNKTSLKTIFSNFLTFGNGVSDAIMVDNSEWLLNLNYIDFLRNIGKHFSINKMLTMDSISRRIERHQELSFLEFNYMILQSYDFVELAKHYNCNLQMGGSDQWGNMVSGIDLGRRIKLHQLYALTSPLIMTSYGTKMGKTENGSIWLNSELLSPYDYWQFWRNVADLDVERFLKLFTVLPMNEIEKLGKLQGSEINEAKKILATEATALIHGREIAEISSVIARDTFEENITSKYLPKISISMEDLKNGISVIDAFSRYSMLAKSKNESRRYIKNSALKVNGNLVIDENMILTISDLNSEGHIKLSMGKKKHVLLCPFDN